MKPRTTSAYLTNVRRLPERAAPSASIYCDEALRCLALRGVCPQTHAGTRKLSALVPRCEMRGAELLGSLLLVTSTVNSVLGLTVVVVPYKGPFGEGV